MITFKDISIIIPVTSEEPALLGLLKDLNPVSREAEVIVVGTQSLKKGDERQRWFRQFKHSKYLISKPGRARQLNRGAAKAERPFLWFLHADSRLTVQSVRSLLKSVDKDPAALHYFNLRFLPDGPPQMWVNEIGCWIRSNLMGVPFGDQGFCLSKEKFIKIGGFPENVFRGEDHLFVWHARQHGIRPRSTGSLLKTSARRYAEEGWVRLTRKYGQFWIGQAFPEWLKIIKGRLAP